jgi:hypothetical protein
VRPLRAEGVILDGGRRARRQTNINLDVPANGPAHIVQRFVVVPCSSSSCNNAAIRGKLSGDCRQLTSNQYGRGRNHKPGNERGQTRE